MTGREVARAVAILRDGGLVAFPTETVYGLGADAADPGALHRLYSVKGRPPEHPVIVHLAHLAQLDEWAREVPEVARTLAAACWPGPLTLVLRRAPHVHDAATGGLDTVGLRVPSHPLALELLTAFAGGIAAPSANRFGHVSPTTAAAVRSELGGDVDLVLDGGPCSVGIESTIVDCSGREPRVLREGGVTRERLRELLGADVAVGGVTRAPGTLAAHYAPRATVEVIDVTGLHDRAEALTRLGKAVGVLAPSGVASPEVAGSRRLAAPVDVDEYARVLYAALRNADALGLDVILAVMPSTEGVGAAVADRLRRAAASR